MGDSKVLKSYRQYTGKLIFLGAMSRKRKAQQAFPNAKKVARKFRNPSQPLESERHTKKSEILDIDSNLLKDGSNRPNDMSKLLLDIPDSSICHLESAPLESEDSALSEHQVNPDDRHGPHDTTMSNNDSLLTEMLSEDPISLMEVLKSGDPTLDIHNQIIGRFSKDLFFKQIIEKPANYRNFKVSNGVVYLKDNDKQILCIPDVKVGEW